MENFFFLKKFWRSINGVRFSQPARGGGGVVWPIKRKRV